MNTSTARMELSIKTVAINNGLHAKEDENAGKASKEMKIAHRSGKGKEDMEKNFRSVRSKMAGLLHIGIIMEIFLGN